MRCRALGPLHLKSKELGGGRSPYRQEACGDAHGETYGTNVGRIDPCPGGSGQKARTKCEVRTNGKAKWGTRRRPIYVSI